MSRQWALVMEGVRGAFRSFTEEYNLTVFDAAAGASPSEKDLWAAIERFAPKLASQWKLNQANPADRALLHLPAEQREEIKTRALRVGLAFAVKQLPQETTGYRVEGNGRQWLLKADGSPVRGTLAEIGPDLTFPQFLSKVRSRAIDEARKVALDYALDVLKQSVPEEGEVLFSSSGPAKVAGPVNVTGEESIPFENTIKDERLVEERNPTLQAVLQQATPTERKILNAWDARLSKSGYLSQYRLATAVATDLGMAPATVRVHLYRLRARAQKTPPVQVPDKPDDQLEFEDYDRMMRETPCLQPGTRLVKGKLRLTEALLRRITVEAEAEVRLGLMPETRRIPTAEELGRWKKWANWERGKDERNLRRVSGC
jgi:hypothetical protein